MPAICNDLSSGGVAFFCVQPLEPGELLEMVLPVTKLPLLMRVQVLRIRPSNEQIPLYAAKFVDMVEGQETAIREAVFGHQIQFRHERRRAEAGTENPARGQAET
jgi:hypothetical protein